MGFAKTRGSARYIEKGVGSSSSFLVLRMVRLFVSLLPSSVHIADLRIVNISYDVVANQGTPVTHSVIRLTLLPIQAAIAAYLPHTVVCMAVPKVGAHD